ncbi:MAG: exodeoxyribonuclease III [Nanoarchaeota archaeon]
MKIISWNVNGIRAILNKGFVDFIEEEAPDIICIQETKAHPSQVEINLPNYSHHFWNAAEKKGYSGTAIFSKIKPLSVTYGMNVPEHDQEGRIITVELKDYFLVNVYVPNSGRGFPHLIYRHEWDEDFLNYLKQLELNKPVIVCGDLNVAHTPIDLTNPDENYNKTAGYTQIEIDGFENFINSGFIDSFRQFNQQGGNYTYWSYMFNARQRNIGWRIDYFLLSKLLQENLANAFILPKVTGSDHCPIGIVLK